ncbi:MAG: patatin-like phospholipase family protein [Nevskiaceae bacterium]|nr:MAG: patatin-like phospholipase family protein [Nevskiaceae bacterium]
MIVHFPRLLLLAGVLLLASCAAAPVAAPTPPTPIPPKPPKIALVLGGGAIRGFAHIGVIKILQAENIVPDMVIGTSAGSVAGALYAAGYSGFDLQQMAFELDKATVTDWSMFGNGLLKGEALQAFVNKAAGNKNIEDLPRPFACVATRLDTGEGVLFQRGNLGMAVRASSSVPGIFQPVTINGVEYVDGGLVSPVPVRYARQMGADFIIAVDVSTPPSAAASAGKMDVLMRTFDIMGKSIRGWELPQADIVVRPDLSKVSSTDIDAKHQAILEGERAMLMAMPALKAKLQARSQPSLQTATP